MANNYMKHWNIMCASQQILMEKQGWSDKPAMRLQTLLEDNYIAVLTLKLLDLAPCVNDQKENYFIKQ